MDGSTGTRRRPDQEADSGVRNPRWRMARRTLLTGATSVGLLRFLRFRAGATVPPGYGRGYRGGYR